jgi:hypothetical protein
MKVEDLEAMKRFRDAIKSNAPSFLFSGGIMDCIGSEPNRLIAILVDDLEYCYDKIKQLETAIFEFEEELKANK